MTDEIPPFQGTDNYVEYFEIKDPTYINNLKVILKKLRRYRWLYHESSNFYKYKNDIIIYYPTFVCGILISILSLFAGASVNQNDSSVTATLNYIVAILGLIINSLHRLQTKEEYETKRIRFSEASHTCDILIVKVSSEIKFPNDNPEQFILDMDDQIVKMKERLIYEPSTKLVVEYVKAEAENPSEISSEDLKLASTPRKLDTNNASIKSSFKKDCYDYDVIDEMRVEKEREIKQKNILDHPNKSVQPIISPRQNTFNNHMNTYNPPTRQSYIHSPNRYPVTRSPLQSQYQAPYFNNTRIYPGSETINYQHNDGDSDDVIIDVPPTPLPPTPNSQDGLETPNRDEIVVRTPIATKDKELTQDNASNTSIESFDISDVMNIKMNNN
jgi:hypothetical protein